VVLYWDSAAAWVAGSALALDSASVAAQAWAAALYQGSAEALVVGSALALDSALYPDSGSCRDLVLCPDLALHRDSVLYRDLGSYLDLVLSRDLALCPDLGSCRDSVLCPDLALHRDSVLYRDSGSYLDSASYPGSALSPDSVWVAASAADLDWVSAAVEDCSVPKACDSAAACTDDSADGSSAGDSANCRRIRDGYCSKQGADDTKGAGDDKDFPILPRRCDCNKRDSSPNSIPNRPNPMAGYWRSSLQSRFPLQK
jgi:hypothetical protein